MNNFHSRSGWHYLGRWIVSLLQTAITEQQSRQRWQVPYVVGIPCSEVMDKMLAKLVGEGARDALDAERLHGILERPEDARGFAVRCGVVNENEVAILFGHLSRDELAQREQMSKISKCET